MPEPTPTYTPEDFQAAIEDMCETWNAWIGLLTCAQGLAQQIPELTRALAAKTQELADMREWSDAFMAKARELKAANDAAEQQTAKVQAALIETQEQLIRCDGYEQFQRAEAAEQQLATVKAAIEYEKRLGHTLSLGPLYGERTPTPVIRLAPIEAALLGDGPGPALAPPAEREEPT